MERDCWIGSITSWMGVGLYVLVGDGKKSGREQVYRGTGGELDEAQKGGDEIWKKEQKMQRGEGDLGGIWEYGYV